VIASFYLYIGALQVCYDDDDDDDGDDYEIGPIFGLLKQCSAFVRTTLIYLNANILFG